MKRGVINWADVPEAMKAKVPWLENAWDILPDDRRCQAAIPHDGLLMRCRKPRDQDSPYCALHNGRQKPHPASYEARLLRIKELEDAHPPVRWELMAEHGFLVETPSKFSNEHRCEALSDTGYGKFTRCEKCKAPGARYYCSAHLASLKAI